jgi:hypothetical protein
MTARRPLLPWLLGAIIVLLAAALLYVARDELGLSTDDRDEGAPARSAVAELQVRISEPAQDVAGIRTAALAPARFAPAVEALGVVVNPAPLVELRARLLTVRAEADAMRAAARFSGQERDRLQALYDDDRNVSKRAVQSADAVLRGEAARVTALERSATGLQESLRAQWGDAIARLATDPRAPFFQEISTQRALLVQLTLPAGAEPPAVGTRVAVTSLNAPGPRRQAVLLSSAPFADPVVLGPTFLFRVAAAPELRVGYRVKGEFPSGGEPREGVAVPPAAVVYHGGKAWVYVKTGAESFARREIATRQEVEGGWFDEGLAAGDAVVVSGAQLLLSEELKYQIRNENED